MSSFALLESFKPGVMEQTLRVNGSFAPVGYYNLAFTAVPDGDVLQRVCCEPAIINQCTQFCGEICVSLKF